MFGVSLKKVPVPVLFSVVMPFYVVKMPKVLWCIHRRQYFFFLLVHFSKRVKFSKKKEK